MMLTFYLAAMALFLAYCATSSNTHKQPPPSELPPTMDGQSSLKSIGMEHGWETYSPFDGAEYTDFMPETAKIIFEMKKANGEISFVAIKKRAKDQRKNRRWEFPGGRLETNESVTEALNRELLEEDVSGVLSRILLDRLNEAASAPGRLLVRKLVLSNGERHVLFKTSIEEKEWVELAMAWYNKEARVNEVRKFLLLSTDDLNLEDPKVRDQWTPKAQKILRALL